MSSPMPTEMTIRNFLLKELEKRAVKVSTEISYSTPIGRLVPDMLLHNGAQYVVETKLGAESKLLDAIVRLYDYSKYTEAKGAFAILFPEELRRPWTVEVLEKIAIDPKLKYIATAIFKDFRPSQRFVGNLSEVADWIASQVLKPLAVEADTGFAIKVLTEAVDSMTLTAKSLKTTDLEEIFGGKTVFENILQYEEGHYPLEEMRQAATYLLVNQIIFYHVLSKADPQQFEAIEENKINKPIDLLKYFEVVLKKDYTSVFGFDVASKLSESAVDTIKRVIVVVKALAPEKIGHDVLGKVFHDLIPFNIRKAVAAFYTNNEAAEILANLSIDKPDATVIDLACGSGTLLVAAYRRKKELLQSGRTELPLEEHRKFLEHDLTGVDIMPFAAHLAVMHLSLQALLHETEKVRVAVWDSTELKPNMNIPAIYSELKAAYRKPTLDMFKDKFVIPKDAHIKKGAITLEGVGREEIPLEKADLVIMNPPFTRQERLPKEYKSSLARRFSEYQTYAHGQLGLWGYFIFLADKFVKQGGRIAFVLPATILRVQSAKGVRKLLTEKYTIEHIITAWERAAFSESAQFREILLIAKKKGRSKDENVSEKSQPDCTVTVLKALPKDLNTSKRFADEIKKFSSSTEATFQSEDMTSYKVEQRRLKKLQNMFDLIAVENFGLVDLWLQIAEKASPKLNVVNKYLTREKGWIRESVRSRKGGSVQSFFILSDKARGIKKKDVWTVEELSDKAIAAKHRYSGEKVWIPLRSVHRGLRRPTVTMDVTNSLDYIVAKKFEGIKEFSKISIGTDDINFMKPWQKYVESRMGKLAVMRRFDISASGTSLIAFYSSVPFVAGVVTWAVDVPRDEDSKIITLWLNCSINILQVLLNRSETRGAFLEIGKYMLDEFSVLDPKKLSRDEKKELLNVFDKVKDSVFPSVLHQLKERFHFRVEMDKGIFKVMGFAKDETDRILKSLYPALAYEIEKLKTLMEG